MTSEIDNTSIGDRLLAERTRLGYNLRDFAALGGIGKSTQSNYEQGKGQPTADYLNRISEAGAEVFWIMRGTQEDDAARDKRVAMYTPEIRDLIEDYKRCPPEIQQSLRALASASARKVKGKK